MPVKLQPAVPEQIHKVAGLSKGSKADEIRQLLGAPWHSPANHREIHDERMF